MKISNGHQAVMPYLMLKGAAAFIDFTTSVFNAELTHKKMKNSGNDIMHAEVTINGSTIMFCDAPSQMPAVTANLFVYVDNADESFKKSIAAGAEMVMELSDQDYGRTCGVKDPLGNVWWITSIQ